jgi:hypothetical protein
LVLVEEEVFWLELWFESEDGLNDRNAAFYELDV